MGKFKTVLFYSSGDMDLYNYELIETNAPINDLLKFAFNTSLNVYDTGNDGNEIEKFQKKYTYKIILCGLTDSIKHTEIPRKAINIFIDIDTLYNAISEIKDNI